MIINDIPDDILIQLSMIKPAKQIQKPTYVYIPERNIHSMKDEYKKKIYECMKQWCEKIKNDQYIYNDAYQKKLHKRRAHIKSSIQDIRNQMASSDIDKTKNVVSKIRFLQEQGADELTKILITNRNSIKIFKFLHSLELQNEYPWLHDFLARKIVFDVEVPTASEISSLRNLVAFLQNSRGGY